MKNLIKNIWQAPSSTIAGGLVAAIGIAIASDIEMPKSLIVALSAVSAFLAVFDGPNKGGPPPRLPMLMAFSLTAFCLPSCTGLTTEQNDRILDSAIPVVREIVIRATK